MSMFSTDGALVGAGGDGVLEGVEVGDQQVDAADVVLLHGGGVAGVVAHAEQAAVDRRMQGLHPPVHDLGKAGERR